jgi:hypothetical protein
VWVCCYGNTMEFVVGKRKRVTVDDGQGFAVAPVPTPTVRGFQTAEEPAGVVDCDSSG